MPILHVVPRSPLTNCSGAPTSAGDIVTQSELGTYVIYMLGYPGEDGDPQTADGLRGLQLAIDYTPFQSSQNGGSGLFISSWTHCSDLQFAQEDWPSSPGSGNTLTWGPCQTSEIVTAGFFVVEAYSPSYLAVVPISTSGQVKTANCAGAESIVPYYSRPWVALGGGTYNGATGGCNPVLESCAVALPLEETTWGQLKKRY